MEEIDDGRPERIETDGICESCLEQLGEEEGARTAHAS
jgi:hypothetical protein